MSPPERRPHYYTDLARLGAYAAYVEMAQGKEASAELYGQIGRMATENEIPEGYWHWWERAPYEDYMAGNHAELLKAYDDTFAVPIAQLRERLAAPDAPEPLAKTHIVQVHAIQVDGKKYAVRLVEPHLEEIDMRSPNAQAETQTYANNIAPARNLSPRLEQLAAYSAQDAVTVAEFIESVPLTPDVVEKIPDGHIDGLFNTAEDMVRLDLEPDTLKPSNMPYDPQKGFHVIDFFKRSGKGPAMLPSNVIGDLVVCVLTPTNNKLEDLPLTPESYQARLRLVDRFIQRCHLRYGTIDPETVGSVERQLAHFKSSVLKQAADRWHRQQLPADAGQPANSAERHGSSMPLAEVLRGLEAAASITERISHGLATDVTAVHGVVQLLQDVLNGNDTQLAEDILSDTAVAWDHLQQALLLLQEGRQALDVAVQDYRGHPL